MAQLRQRLGIVLQHLAAHGRTTVVKGCREAANRGWRRSPLGGGGGMQYYLWWTVQGSRPARDVEFPGQGCILVRAVRHHDDHGRLDAGVLDDYLSFSQHEIEDADLVGRPWTPEQLQFMRHEGPVRLVHGRPGSGKTTVLWKAVEARSGQRILYLTWSRELTAAAEEHFRAFAPADVRVEARDFATFLGEVCGADVERRSLSESRAEFAAATARLGTPAGRAVGGPRRGAACRGAGDAARPRRARRPRLGPGRRPRPAERHRVPRPAGGPRRSRPGGGERPSEGARTHRAGRSPASSRSWRRRRWRSHGCATTSCRQGLKSSTASSSTRSRT